MKAILLKTEKKETFCLQVEEISSTGNTANCIFGIGLKVQIKRIAETWNVFKAVDGYGVDKLSEFQNSEITPLFEKQPVLKGIDKMISDLLYYQNLHNTSQNPIKSFLSDLIKELSNLIDEQEIIDLNQTDHENPDKRYQY